MDKCRLAGWHWLIWLAKFGKQVTETEVDEVKPRVCLSQISGFTAVWLQLILLRWELIHKKKSSEDRLYVAYTVNMLKEGFVGRRSPQTSRYHSYTSSSNALTMAAVDSFWSANCSMWLNPTGSHEAALSLCGKANFCKQKGQESQIKTLGGSTMLLR